MGKFEISEDMCQIFYPTFDYIILITSPSPDAPGKTVSCSKNSSGRGYTASVDDTTSWQIMNKVKRLREENQSPDDTILIYISSHRTVENKVDSVNIVHCINF